ncbi:MAG: archease [Candidatus Omnitrophota bacterium]|nr:MAG: archease [Candidatus Omnitrophota bacterium]
MKEFEFIEHTADIGVRVYGRSLEELFTHAATALFSIILDYKPQQLKSKEIELEASTLEDLFVIWLNELISGFFADKFLPADYRIEIKDAPNKKILKVRLRGQDFNPYENKISAEVKAATYHNLKIEKVDKGYKVEVIFDV